MAKLAYHQRNKNFTAKWLVGRSVNSVTLRGLQRGIGAFAGLPSGATGSRHLRRCVSCKGHPILCETCLAANGFPSRFDLITNANYSINS
jgi:hypothetical protein